jgi:hypothetical protein
VALHAFVLHHIHQHYSFAPYIQSRIVVYSGESLVNRAPPPCASVPATPSVSELDVGLGSRRLSSGWALSTTFSAISYVARNDTVHRHNHPCPFAPESEGREVPAISLEDYANKRSEVTLMQSSRTAEFAKRLNPQYAGPGIRDFIGGLYDRWTGARQPQSAFDSLHGHRRRGLAGRVANALNWAATLCGGGWRDPF